MNDELDFPDYVSPPPKSQHVIHSTITKIEKIDPITGDIIEVKKTHFFYLALQDKSGKIVKIIHDTSYDKLLEQGMQEAKSIQGTWSIFNLKGRFVDGNFGIR